MTNSKDNKRRKAALLGMPVGTAERKLRKSIIHELARQCGKNLCRWCHLEISDPDDLALTHVEDWEECPELFFDLGNVALSHASCAAARGGRRQGEESEMRVEISVEDAHGNRLHGAKHEGQLYVVARKGERYQVRVRNRTGKRILVVTTVDGRNVQTGEPGDVHDSGHVLGPHQSWVFKGWRTSDNEVAAFAFGKKGDSYSSQMGSSENVGVIGVAVFEEKEPEPKIITVKEREYVPYPVYPNPWRRPWYEPTWTLFGTSQTVGVAQASSTVSSTSDSYELNAGDLQFSSLTVSSSVDSSPATSGSSVSKRSRKRGRAGGQAARQELGTEFGQALHSSVVSTSFVRASDEPAEVHTVRYDSLEALRRRGVRVGSGRREQVQEPSAFPRSPGAENGYCQPPPRRRASKNG